MSKNKRAKNPRYPEQFHLYLPEGWLDQLEFVAKTRDMTTSALIRSLIRRELRLATGSD